MTISHGRDLESTSTSSSAGKPASVSAGDGAVLLVTGGTGLVGSHVCEVARRRGWRVRTIARPGSATGLLEELGVELTPGDLTDPAVIDAALRDVTRIVHCAAKLGDWGPTAAYRLVNVTALAQLLDAAQRTGRLARFVHVSSLGVYPAIDHYGTDERTPPSTTGIDGYTLTKIEAEQLVAERIRTQQLPATILRPGFIYGPRDRTVLPKLIERLRSRQFAYLGSPDKVMNNTYVGHLVQAIFLALDAQEPVRDTFNITDGRLVTKREFIETIAIRAGLPVPTRIVPLGVARALATGLEFTWKLLGKTAAPLLSHARIKFLGLNLDFDCSKAQRELGYCPSQDFQETMATSIEWFR